MSYDIYIGERERITYGTGEDSYTYTGVRRIEQDDAPQFDMDDLTGKSNGRHPGYGQFDEFCRIVGLHDLFFNSTTGLMREHPGCQDLEIEHVEAVREVLDRWLTEHPDGTPGFLAGQDMILPRLLWFDWWMTRAIVECEHPAIYNT